MSSRLFGALVALVLTLATATAPRPTEDAPRLGDGEGRIAAWLLHFDPDSLENQRETLRDLIDGAGPESRVVVALADTQDGPGFRALIAEDDEERLARVEFLEVGHGLTPWARDRYVVCDVGGRSRVLLPRPEGVQRERSGDADVGRALVRLFPELRVIETDLDFEGGDLVLAEDRVLAGLGFVAANLPRVNGDLRSLRSVVRELFGRELVVLGRGADELPHEHADMYVAALGKGELILGDPRLALPYFAQLRELGLDEVDLRGIDVFRRERQIAMAPIYDTIALELESLGFSLRRVPALHGENGELLTWTNAVIDRADPERPRVFLPSYDVPLLDRAAARAWTAAGFEIVPIRADQAIRLGGAVRCMSNVIRRPAVGTPRAAEAEVGAAGR